MKNITFTQEQKSQLRSKHKKCRDKRKCDRIKTVLLSDEGRTPAMIAQALRKHEASIVRHLDDFIQKEKLNIKLHYLPPYSPNLNPIERLWKVMNKHARNNQYFTKPKEFRKQIERFFQNCASRYSGVFKQYNQSQFSKAGIS